MTDSVKPPEYEIDPDDLEPTIDLSLALQKQILFLCARLASDDHYALLGVAQDADKKEIRNCYFKLMKEFHEDRFYGKELGLYRQRIRKIVDALTRSNNTLTRKRTRLEYDRYLASRCTTLGARLSHVPAPRDSDVPSQINDEDGHSSRSSAAPVDFVPNIPKHSKAPVIVDFGEEYPETGQKGETKSSVIPSSPLLPSGEAPPPRPTDSSKPSARRAGKSDAAKRLLARKMGGVSRRAPRAIDASQVRAAVSADLKSRYEAKRTAERGKEEKYLALGRAAREAGDWSSAVNALRLVVDAVPDNVGFQEELAEVQKEADRALAPKFLEQARYEEKDGRYERAARSYERAARGNQSAELFHEGALCLLKASNLAETEVRKMAEMGREAVNLDKNNAAYRLTLAKAYDVAGMRSSALGEVRRALELEPDNNDAKKLQKELK